MSTALPDYEVISDAGVDAPWLVLVHGASQHRGVFSAQVAAFRSHYRLLLIDLPGHGGSSHLPGPYGLNEYADAVLAAMETARATGGHYWGTHTGAGVGLLLAARQPQRVRSLILEGPVLPGRQLSAVSEMFERVTAVAQAEGVDAARSVWWEHSGWFAVMRARPIECRAAEQRAMIDRFQGAPWLDATPASPVPPVEDNLAHLSIPVLIYNGEHDLPDFLDVAETLEELLPAGQRATIAEAGGFPLWEFPGRVNATVREFLSSPSR